MPELPDLAVYLECVEDHALGDELTGIRVGNPFILRTVTPRPSDFAGLSLRGTARIGKRMVLNFDRGLHAVIHLMILGRLHWKKPAAPLPKGSGLAAFDFRRGSLQLTESGSKRRASLHLVEGPAGLAALDRGGLEVMDASLPEFSARLRSRPHTLKRALADPVVFAAIGNAYSDEILHRARLSPFKTTSAIDEADVRRLFDATRAVLGEWTERLRGEALAGSARWPAKVTAFRPEMAVHGRFGLPCPDCGAPVQRIVYASNECNYCARCQTGGRLLADRALSRLLKDSWPRTLDEQQA